MDQDPKWYDVMFMILVLVCWFILLPLAAIGTIIVVIMEALGY